MLMLLLVTLILGPNLVLDATVISDALSDESGLQPKICVLPEANLEWAIGERFTIDILVENVSGMRGVYFELFWNGFYDDRMPDWFPMLNTSTIEIDVHEDLLPKPYKAYRLTLLTEADRSWLKFMCVLDCDVPPQNGTANIMSITFTVLDPWICGRQPVYTKHGDEWTPYNATSQIVIWWGCFIMQYPSLHYVYFGRFFDDTQGVQDYALYSNSEFTFMPVPGDLDGNGIVDATDLLIIAQFYDNDVTEYPNSYYDLNRDGLIDIFDIVIVTSNYGRNDPL